MIIRQLLMTLLVAMALTMNTAQAELLPVQEISSQNGLKAWLIEDHSLPLITLRFAFEGAGSAQDPDTLSGVAQLLSNTMDEGAADIDSQIFQRNLRDNAISLSFKSNRDHFYGSLSAHVEDWPLAQSLMHKALTAPRFDPKPVQRMIEANQSRIRRALSNPDWLASRLSLDIYFAGHPYARNSGGTLSSLPAITGEDLRAFQSTKFAQNNLRIAIIGDIDAQNASVMIDTLFADLPEQARLKPITHHQITNEAPQSHLYQHDGPQTNYVLVKSGIARNAPDHPVYELFNAIVGGSGFGSRLMESLREHKGLTYGIYSYNHDYSYANQYVIEFSGDNASAAQAIETLHAELDDIKQIGFDKKALNTAKSYLIGRAPLGLTNSSDIASYLLNLQLNGFDKNHYTQRLQAINAVSLETLNNFAKTFLKEPFTTIMVGSPENLETDNIITEIPGAH